MVEQSGSRVRIIEHDGKTVIVVRPKVAVASVVWSGLVSLGSVGLATLVVGWALFDGWPPFYYPQPPLSERIFAACVIAGAAIGTLRVLRIFTGFVLFRERIVCGDGLLSLRRGAVLLSLSDCYDLRYISRLRAVAQASLIPDPDARDPWHSTTGRNVAFDYGPQTLRFGLRMDGPEAQEVAALIALRGGTGGRSFSYSDAPIPREELVPGARALPSPRARVEETGPELRVTVPAPRSFTFAILCGIAVAFLIWQGIQVAQEWSAHSVMASHHLWLCVVFLLATTRRALWNAFGRETILLSREDLVFTRHYGVFKIKRKYSPLEITRVYISLRTASPLGGNALPDRGSVAIATRRGDVWRFGVGLEEAEAEALRRLLLDRLGLFTGAP